MHVQIFFLHVVVLDAPGSVSVQRDSRASEPRVPGVDLVLGLHPVTSGERARGALVAEYFQTPLHRALRNRVHRLAGGCVAPGPEVDKNLGSSVGVS